LLAHIVSFDIQSFEEFCSLTLTLSLASINEQYNS